MVDRVVRVQLVGDATSLVQAANQAASALRTIGGSAGHAGTQAASGANQAQSAWERFKSSVAAQVAVGDLISKGVEGAFGLLKDGFSAVINQGLDYERNMNTLSAVTGASADEMSRLGARAKALGNDITIPGASAGDAALAMRELAKGGLNVRETMQAAAGTLRLAAAAQVDGGRAAEIQANALNAFRLEADQADHVADLLANAANAASGEVTDMAAALQQAGTVANGFGISVDDTTTSLALFAKNGIQGSDAGTGFKTMLTALASPTAAQARALDQLNLKVYDANGQFVGMSAITAQLAAAHKSLTTEQYNAAASTAFGTDAIRAANILGQEGTQGWLDMASAVGKAGGAQELAAAQTQGLSGALDRLWNAGSTVALTLYEEVSPALVSVADFGATAFGWLGDALGWLGDLPTPVYAAVTAFGAMILLKNPLTGFALAVKGELLALRLQIQSLKIEAALSGTSLGTMGAAMRLAGIHARAFGAALKTAFLSNPIGLAIVGVTTALSFFIDTNDDAATATEGLAAAIDDTTGKLKENAAEIIAQEAANSGAAAAYERLGGKASDYVDALGGVPGAQEKVNAVIDGARVVLDQQQKAMLDSARGTSNFGTAMGAAGDAAAGTVPALDDVNSASEFLRTGTDKLNTTVETAAIKQAGLQGELGKTDGALQDAEKAATPFADALKALKGEASEADAATQFLIGSLQQLTDGSISAEQMQRQNSAAMRDVVASARALADANAEVSEKTDRLNTLTSKLGTEFEGQVVTQAMVDAAARDLADAQDGVSDASDRQFDSLGKLAENAMTMAGAAYNAKAAQGDYRGATKDATAVMEEQRKKFIETVLQINGNNIPAAEELANKYGLIPKNVDTTFTQQGLPSAITEVQRLRKEINDLPDSKIVKVAVESGDVVYTTEAGTKFKRDGGYISGPGSGTSDSIPARLSNGEFVVRASQTAKHRGLLEHINTPGYAQGGIVDTNQIITQMSAGNLVETGWMAGVNDQAAKIAKNIWQAVGFIGNGQWGPANPGGLAANTAAARDFIMKRWGITNIGGWRASGSVPGSDHPMGKALDVMISNYLSAQGIAQGTSVADWFVSNPNAFGTKYVIWRDRINQGGAWAPYSHPGGNNDTLAHRDHVHLSFRTGSGQFAAGGSMGDAPGGGAAAAGGSGVERWRPLMADVLAKVGAYKGLNLSGYTDRGLMQINSESSGRENVWNTTDSNARKGTPSGGLLQVIRPTFEAALRGTPFEGLIAAGLLNPRANLTASTLYSLNRYGSLDRAWQGRAYRYGGQVVGPGGPFDDMIDARLSNGEFVVNARAAAANLPALNAINSGGFEYTRGQMQSSAANIASGIVAELAQLRDIVSQLPVGGGGVNIENLNAYDPQQAMAEVEYALARCR